MRISIALCLCVVLFACNKILPYENVFPDGLDAQLAVDQGPGEPGTSHDVLAPDLLVPDLPCGGASCTLGCNTALNRCFRLKPSNVSDVVQTELDGLEGKLVNVVLSGAVTVDTDTGLITAVDPSNGTTTTLGGGAGDGGVFWFPYAQQGSGYPEISLFMVGSLDLTQGTTFTVVGKRAFALYAHGDVTIAGVIAAPANHELAGAGGFAGGAQSNQDAELCFGGEGKGGSYTATYGSGGGGGGHGKAGGPGGAVADALAGAGGTPVNKAELVPLAGGCGGGAGGGSGSALGGPGGGGGGAIQISANGALQITSTGVISAPGGGGTGAIGTAPKHAGGGGGGSGGAILLEAAQLVVENGSVIAANGAGGGSGGGIVTTQLPGEPGQDGTPDISAALGGVMVTTSAVGGAGGNGGALVNPTAASDPEEGQAGVAQYNGGGGGGGVGRIRLNGTLAAPADPIKPWASPAPSTSDTVDTW
jgi:hypothetical protein